MPTEPQASMNTQVFEIYIKASPQTIWDAITSPEWNAKYGYKGPMHFELRAGGKFQTRANADMQRMGLPEESKAEGFTKVTYEIEQTPAGFSRLTVIHDLQGAPAMAQAVKSKFNLQGG